MLLTLNIQDFVPLPESFKFWVGCLHHLFRLEKQPPASPGNYLGYMGDDDVGLVYSLSSWVLRWLVNVLLFWKSLSQTSQSSPILVTTDKLFQNVWYIIRISLPNSKTIKCIGVKEIVMFDYFWHIKSSYYWRFTAQFHLPHKSDLTQVTHFGGSTVGVSNILVLYLYPTLLQ